MAGVLMKKVLVILSTSPFQHTSAREGQDLVMALAAVEHQVSVLYCGAGVLQLRHLATPSLMPVKDFTVQQKLFALYDIAAVYACADSVRKWAVDVSFARTDITLVDVSQLDLTQFDYVIEN